MLVKDNSKSAVKDLYYLAVLSASRRFLWPPLRKLIGAKNIRFATREEAIAKTGCLPGAIPPFGSIFGVKTFVDDSLMKQGEMINFTAGIRTCSIQMKGTHYLELENPAAVGVFSDEAPSAPEPAPAASHQFSYSKMKSHIKNSKKRSAVPELSLIHI
eukprot:TRINITY_DN3207_c0_g1_i4.p2 TRINITY_DN3207_c0_g1~~TRINITY_DN3207_c0_g1_i4.p2  ORF type:complete len:158 (+),score=24.48 TRINITY_DN3207_c0_g1_i4:297-770(+)